MEDGIIKVARNLLFEGIEINLVVKTTGLSEDKLERLAKEKH